MRAVTVRIEAVAFFIGKVVYADDFCVAGNIQHRVGAQPEEFVARVGHRHIELLDVKENRIPVDAGIDDAQHRAFAKRWIGRACRSGPQFGRAHPSRSGIGMHALNKIGPDRAHAWQR